MNIKHPDAKIIDSLGGPSQFCRLLGFDPKNGAQRVHNWTYRGIPPRVQLDHPHIFTLAAKLIAENKS